MKTNIINFDLCVERLRRLGEIVIKSNHADELVKHCHGKIGKQTISFGDLTLDSDGLYRTLYLA